jgi:hypothetical protein
MSAQTRKSTYDQVVDITYDYLGPAASRFVNRQVRNHLHKEPTDMTRKDLHGLILWIQLAMSLLTDDAHIVEEYIEQLEQVAAGSKSPNNHTIK